MNALELAGSNTTKVLWANSLPPASMLMQYVQSLNLASQSHLLQDISLINLIRSRTGLSIVYLMALNALLSRLCFILQSWPLCHIDQVYSMPNFYFDSYIIHQTNSLITYCLISASHVVCYDNSVGHSSIRPLVVPSVVSPFKTVRIL